MLILKQLRRKKSISQSDLANAIGVSLRTIQLYEKENANIPIKNLTKLADYFEMGIDQLYAQEVNESNGIYDSKTKDLKKGHSIQKLGPGRYLVSAPVFMGGLQYGYSEKLEDAKALRSLPQIGFIVDQVSVGSYLAFEITNNAMDNDQANGIPQGSIVLGKRVSLKELSRKVKNAGHYWILVCEDTIMCKEITAYDKKGKFVRCHSLNDSPEYPDFEVSTSEIVAFYMIVKKQVD